MRFTGRPRGAIPHRMFVSFRTFARCRTGGRPIRGLLWLIALAGCDRPHRAPADNEAVAIAEPAAAVAAPDGRAAPEQPPVDPAAAAAFRTLFGGDEMMSTLDDAVTFRPGGLVRSGEAEILIARGTRASSAHPDPGYIGAWYLRRDRSALAIAAAYPRLVAAGTFGDPPDWRMRDDLGDQPVLEVDGFGMWFGHAFTCTTLVALGPRGPRTLLGPVLTGYEYESDPDDPGDEPSADTRGSIRYDQAHDRFIIAYAGTVRGTVTYARAGARYRPTSSNAAAREARRCSG